ncbi:MAG: hypothetical protein L6R39_002041 [Caloplaca ligustica]|nr:MAG: hypothetical protein L6R39_002041 [Caloplaca ligustica]
MPHRILDELAPAVMGNTSSQLAPPATDGQPDMESSKRKDTKKRKKGRDPSARVVQTEEEESAHISMLPRRSRAETLQSTEDDAAASAQLFAESSAPEFLLPAAHEEPNNTRSGYVSPRGEHGGRRRKRTSSAVEQSLDANHVHPGAMRYDSAVSLELGRVAGCDGAVENNLGSSQRIFSIDDIDENEEGLASLFQEYETQATSPMSPIADALGLKAQDCLQDTIDPELANEPFGNGRKGKRKRSSGSGILGVSAEQELMNGTGQHAFDVDFAAFDEIFANEGMQLANPFNEESGHDLANESGPSEESFPIHVAEDTLPDLDNGSTRGSEKTGELPRVSSVSRPKKRRRTEIPNSFDSQVATYVSPYAPNQGQQDRVLPGIEDMQHRSSSEVPYSHSPGLADGSHAASVSERRRQTPPPPLEKPSKPRGNKKQRGGKKGKDYNPPLQEVSEKGGMFSDAEIEVLDAFRDQYCEENNESQWRFNELIQTNIRGHPEVMRLFMAIHDQVPYRTRQSVIRFCRRHFHNFSARGSWTEADDKLLADAIAKKGTAWKAVGEMIHRFPEDCRDRYRNYLVNREKRNTEGWSIGEIRNLVKAVDFCMRLLREQRVQAREEKYEGHDLPESEPESDQEVQDMKLINWQVVSDRMGGTRSRLQCSYKWNHLKNEDREKYLQEIRRLEKGLNPRTEADITGSWRLRRAMKKLTNMKTGDKYDFLQAFAECGAPTEKDIRWNTLGDHELRQRWSAMDFKAALALFKSQTPNSDRMSYQELVNRVLTRLMAEDPDGLEDRWDAEVDGDINKIQKKSARQRQREQMLSKAQNPQKRSKIKSKDFIDSDDEAEAEEEQSSNTKAKGEEGRKFADNADGHPPRIMGDSTDEGSDWRPSSEIGASGEGRDGEHRDRQLRASIAKNRHPSPSVADSAEEGSNGHRHPVIVASDEGQDEEQRSSQSNASTRENKEEVEGNAVSSSEGGELSTPTPHGKADDSSSDESDDSLFHDGGSVGGELVDQLQRLRDA